ncbi:G1/S-specific cyclin-E-like isoform X2 [Saccoglossus kowalevskii]|uniref:G1/S-specific cyclin-E-like isoform X1 n=1 Tax=Saccoglossus kowalevskii TaxID=10224 RepID=A0ABM0MAV9_SACKO|nr:PREDICTED: G1/S-specific cyclin-E-like isoform X1 [Saccoglossus kowalevskii]XP_006817150.1 PREDICTED: G1/S-specific cyclin-E-like isoform X2 [Saccoglossus kowalevskii]
MSRRSGRLAKKGDAEEVKLVVCGKRKAECALEEENRTMQIQRRRQQFQIKNSWIPISESSSVATCSLVPTVLDTHEDRLPATPVDFVPHSKFQFRNLFPMPSLRTSPLPFLNWADSREVWDVMVQKESSYTRDDKFLDRHPHIHAKMRSILLDWLIEVCEVYRLHRETYYLAQDFVDRYLATQKDIPKTRLQLIGITALFVAAKLEEIYPPRLSEFAYVTDGACTENEILIEELVVLKALNWDLSPITVNTWLNIYLQLCHLNRVEDSGDDFTFPHYSANMFIQVAQLIDLCMLDIDCLQFSYSILATSALYHMASPEISFKVSGLKWDDIATCVQWMTAFSITIRESGIAPLKHFSQVLTEDSHNIQTHVNDISTLERAQERQSQINSESLRNSPVLMSCVLTPPQSTEKHGDIAV